MRYTVERWTRYQGWHYWLDAADEFTAYRFARMIARQGDPARVIDTDTNTILHSLGDRS